MEVENQEPHSPDTLPSRSTRSFSPKRRLYLLGKTLYRAVPPRVRALLYPVAANTVLLRRLRPEVWIVSGEARGSHLPLSICLYSVTDEQKSYLQSLIFGTSFQARFVGRTWLWKAFVKLPEAAQGCSMIIAEVHESHLKWMGPSTGIVIPSWVRGYAQLPRGPEVMKRDSIKDILRKIRQQGLECEATRDPKAFDFFYERMYLPYSKLRYGEGAFISPREEIKAMFDRGDLILVKKQNEYIAGLMVVYGENGALMPYLGVLDGRWEFVTKGALAASYEFALRHLEKTGCRRVSFGQSRGFLNDGVLLFKKKYQTISGSSNYKYVTKVLSDTSATRAVLRGNPFIFQHGGEFHGAVFVGAEVPPTLHLLQEMHKLHSYAGLSEIIVFFLSEGGAPTLQPAEFQALVEPTPDKSTPPQKQPHYQLLTEAEYAPLISGLGPIGIATAIAIRPHKEH